MAIGADHLDDLARQRTEHVVRIQNLSQKIAELENERRVHERVVALISSPKIMQVLTDLVDDPNLAELASQNLASFCESRDLELPEEFVFTIELIEDEVHVKVRHDDHLFSAQLQWSPTRGFGGSIFVNRSKVGSKEVTNNS